jgi:hypothetical protein
VKTRLSACRRKRRFATEAEVRAASEAGAVPLRWYRCDRCGALHLTSRTKGKPVPVGER